MIASPKKLLLPALAFLIFSACASSPPTSGSFSAGTSKMLQHDFDIWRLRDLETIAAHIEKYKNLTGKLPLQDKSDLPNYVHIATQEQKRQIGGKPAYPHVVTDTREFQSELERVLGSNISLPFDPQRVSVNKPNFYIYLVQGNQYFLAVHLFNSYPFARQVANHYHKVEISNSGIKQHGIWLYDDLLSEQSFITAKNRQPHKPGYVPHLRKILGGKNAF